MRGWRRNDARRGGIDLGGGGSTTGMRHRPTVYISSFGRGGAAAPPKLQLHNFQISCKRPKHANREIPDVATAKTRLRSRWANCEKPMNAHVLGRQFSLDDLLRVANVDSDLRVLLEKIGLMGGPWRPPTLLFRFFGSNHTCARRIGGEA